MIFLSALKGGFYFHPGLGRPDSCVAGGRASVLQRFGINY